MTVYLNLNNYVIDVIKSCIHEGYVEAGHLKYVVDLHLAAGPSLEFLPSEIKDDVLIIKYKRDGIIHHRTYNITEIINEYMEKINV